MFPHRIVCIRGYQPQRFDPLSSHQKGDDVDVLFAEISFLIWPLFPDPGAAETVTDLERLGRSAASSLILALNRFFSSSHIPLLVVAMLSTISLPTGSFRYFGLQGAAYWSSGKAPSRREVEKALENG